MTANADVADFDLLIIGGGSGGFAAALAAVEAGRRVGVINTCPLGGTCTNRGCIPSKALIRAAQQAGRHPFAGVGSAQISLDWAEVQAQKERLVGELRKRRYVDVLAARTGITLIEGRVAFQPDGLGPGG